MALQITRTTRTFAYEAKLQPVLSAISWPSSGLQADFESAWGAVDASSILRSAATSSD